MNYTWMALLVLAIFYGIYFTKMYLQKRQGIRTHQIGRRKEKGLHTVETFMSVATFAIVIVQLISVMAGWNYMPQSIRYAGFGTGIVGDLIFGVSIIPQSEAKKKLENKEKEQQEAEKEKAEEQKTPAPVVKPAEILQQTLTPIKKKETRIDVTKVNQEVRKEIQQ